MFGMRTGISSAPWAPKEGFFLKNLASMAVVTHILMKNMTTVVESYLDHLIVSHFVTKIDDFIDVNFQSLIDTF